MAAAPTALLINKTAIVTGGTRGIGAGISRELASRGANVAMIFTNPATAEAAENYAAEIATLGGGVKAAAIRVDLGDLEGPALAVEETLKRLNVTKIDIIVNNAAAFDTNPTTQITNEGFEAVMKVNVRAPALLVKAALPHIPRGGSIINIATMGTRMMNNIPMMPPMPLYIASKAALECLSHIWAVEFGHSHGITSNNVSVGLVETDGFSQLPEEYKQPIRAELAKRTAAGPRSGTPDDIAQIVAFLASDESRWVTGSTLSANGGVMTF
ncbi:hypothetical protein ACJ41O_003513 [Fusarium nematophilum]